MFLWLVLTHRFSRVPVDSACCCLWTERMLDLWKLSIHLPSWSFPCCLHNNDTQLSTVFPQKRLSTTPKACWNGKVLSQSKKPSNATSNESLPNSFRKGLVGQVSTEVSTKREVISGAMTIPRKSGPFLDRLYRLQRQIVNLSPIFISSQLHCYA